MYAVFKANVCEKKKLASIRKDVDPMFLR
jgi:hypothetical protein